MCDAQLYFSLCGRRLTWTQTKIDVFWPYVELSQSDFHVENIAEARFGRFRRKIPSGR